MCRSLALAACPTPHRRFMSLGASVRGDSNQNLKLLLSVKAIANGIDFEGTDTVGNVGLGIGLVVFVSIVASVGPEGWCLRRVLEKSRVKENSRGVCVVPKSCCFFQNGKFC